MQKIVRNRRGWNNDEIHAPCQRCVRNGPDVGALGGFLLSLVPAAMEALGFLSMGETEPTMAELTGIIAPPLMIMSGLSAAGSLWLARRAEKKGAGNAELAAGSPDFTAHRRESVSDSRRSSV